MIMKGMARMSFVLWLAILSRMGGPLKPVVRCRRTAATAQLLASRDRDWEPLARSRRKLPLINSALLIGHPAPCNPSSPSVVNHWNPKCHRLLSGTSRKLDSDKGSNIGCSAPKPSLPIAAMATHTLTAESLPWPRPIAAPATVPVQSFSNRAGRCVVAGPPPNPGRVISTFLTHL